MHKLWKRKRALIPKVKHDKDETITSRTGIANVFGEFYSKLDAETQLGQEVQESQNMETRMSNEKKSCSEDVKNEIPEFTQGEVQAAFDNVKKGTASDNGIWAEDIKTCDATTKEMIRLIVKKTAHQKHGEENV